MLRERGSNTVPAQHDPADPQCERAGLVTNSAACCAICGEKLAREQAASAINLRELGS